MSVYVTRNQTAGGYERFTPEKAEEQGWFLIGEHDYPESTKTTSYIQMFFDYSRLPLDVWRSFSQVLIYMELKINATVYGVGVAKKGGGSNDALVLAGPSLERGSFYTVLNKGYISDISSSEMRKDVHFIVDPVSGTEFVLSTSNTPKETVSSLRTTQGSSFVSVRENNYIIRLYIR